MQGALSKKPPVKPKCFARKMAIPPLKWALEEALYYTNKNDGLLSEMEAWCKHYAIPVKNDRHPSRTEAWCALHPIGFFPIWWYVYPLLWFGDRVFGLMGR